MRVHVPLGPTVSVIIPCYRHAAYLAEAIASVDSAVSTEIIVVDDGSPGGLRSALAPWPAVRLLERPHEGVSAARNAGLQICRGRYVLFLDADDRLLPGSLEAGVETLARDAEAGFAFGRYRFIREDGSFGGEPGMTAPAQPAYLDLVRANFIGMLGAVLFRTGAVRDAGGFQHGRAMAEDYELLLRVARAHPMICNDAVVAEYRRYPTSASSNADLMLAGVLDVLARERTVAIASALAAAADVEAVHRAFDEGEHFFRLFYGVRLTRQIVREGLLRGRFRNAGAWACHLVRHLGPETAFVSLPPAVAVAAVRKCGWIVRGWWHRRSAAASATVVRTV